jgi:hypothetical protein
MIVSPMKIPGRGYSKGVGGHVTKVTGGPNHLEATNGLPYDCYLPWFRVLGLRLHGERPEPTDSGVPLGK